MKRITKLLGSAVLAFASTLATAAVGPFSSLVVFGDSLSDSGNNSLVFGNDTTQVIANNGYIPGQTYASGTYSNGPVWATQFAGLLGLPLQASRAGGTNFAHGGAVTGIDQTYLIPAPPGPPISVTLPSLKTQVNGYLGAVGGTVSSTGLFVVAGGGNDARGILEAVAGGGGLGVVPGFVSQYVANVGFMVDALQAAGAQHIVVWNTPNIGVTPAVTAAGGSALGSFIAGSMNGALAARLAGEAGVQTFDIFGLGALAAANGFTNVADACGNPLKSCNGDLSHALFYDGIHPTTAAHSFIASQMAALAAPVPEPSEIAMMLVGLLVLVRFARRKAA